MSRLKKKKLVRSGQCTPFHHKQKEESDMAAKDSRIGAEAKRTVDLNVHKLLLAWKDLEKTKRKPIGRKRGLPKTKRSGRGRSSQTELIPGKPGNPLTPSMLKQIKRLAKKITKQISEEERKRG